MEVVRQLIAALAGQPVVFTLDALYCKKTVEQITQQQQHYSISPAYPAALEHRKPIALGARCHLRGRPCPSGGNAPVIWAILNCFIINIVRQLAYRTIPQGIRALTNQVQQVYTILTQGFPPPK
ncbi:hypothetical protein HNI00_18930 [Thermoleptolyngbya oregonensis NK1-22]|uniref:Uncharacterized protein n=1 Tax=Thermoleptolyngbya oregonensis NK1-22 TaxID=2547457 RepID=A0AA96YRC0_9CYAN|nr:hypothetical protein [Thermoleptolyngbya oregonensis]WOB44992.1 hypothetical protein HNI00_18930 [Thermoleptolyngbya oregonensis NK1-22]